MSDKVVATRGKAIIGSTEIPLPSPNESVLVQLCQISFELLRITVFAYKEIELSFCNLTTAINVFNQIAHK
jgi:hypothetical protein